MTKEELKSSLLDDVDEIIYATQMDNYKLIYANNMTLKIIGKSEKDAIDVPCYKALHDRDIPCPGCCSDIIKKKNYFERDEYVEKFDLYLVEKFRKVKIDDKDVMLCMFTDITQIKKATSQIEKKLRTEATLVKCIRTLYEYEDIGDAINKLLGNLAGYYKADRAYIFEFSDDGNTLDNTYKWCYKGVTPQKDFLQNVDMQAISRWIELFDTKGEVCISAVSQELDKDSLEYELLEYQNIDGLITVPLKNNDKIIGFIGVDNPRDNMEISVLMQSVVTFIQNEIEKRDNIQKLYELSYLDRLTKVGNRHAYVKYMKDTEGRKDMSLGIIFADINGLKQANDKYGHEYGDNMIVEVSNVLKKNFAGHIYRIGGDEFVVFCENIEEQEFKLKVENLKQNWNKGITASVGSMWLKECNNIEENVARTDKLMYQSKKQYYIDKGFYIL